MHKPFPVITRPKLLASLALIFALAASCQSAPASPAPPALAQPRAHTFWQLIWSDEFNGAANTGVNTQDWQYALGTGYGCAGCPPNWGTGEVEVMTDSTANVYHDGEGHLVIRPIHEGDNPLTGWTSGRIETQRTDFAAPVGGILAVEAALQLPNVSNAEALGYWPAFWMLGEDFRGNYLNWPSIGEVDVMENVNGLGAVWATLHCGVTPGGPCNETLGKGSGAYPCAGCQTAFHTYRVEIDRSATPEQIRWYLDGTNFFTLNANQVDAKNPPTWSNAVHHGYFVILNVALGGGFPNGVAGKTTPTATTVSGFPLLVDYVRVYTLQRTP